MEGVGIGWHILSSLCQPRYGVIHSHEKVGKVNLNAIVFKSTFEQIIVPKSGGNIVSKTSNIKWTHLIFLAPNICQRRNQHFFGSSLISTPPQDFVSRELCCKEQTTSNCYNSDIIVYKWVRSKQLLKKTGFPALFMKGSPHAKWCGRVWFLELVDKMLTSSLYPAGLNQGKHILSCLISRTWQRRNHSWPSATIVCYVKHYFQQ